MITQRLIDECPCRHYQASRKVIHKLVHLVRIVFTYCRVMDLANITDMRAPYKYRDFGAKGYAGCCGVRKRYPGHLSAYHGNPFLDEWASRAFRSRMTAPT